MHRKILAEERIHPAARETIAGRHADLITEVEAAIEASPVVVISLGWNPHGKRARKALATKGVAFTYLQYGTYLNNWRRRNALKMWTGWPTFPMVFVRGTLIGGASDLQRLMDSGELDGLLADG